jgi:hypothetical protein
MGIDIIDTTGMERKANPFPLVLEQRPKSNK